MPREYLQRPGGLLLAMVMAAAVVWAWSRLRYRRSRDPQMLGAVDPGWWWLIVALLAITIWFDWDRLGEAIARFLR